MHDSRASHNLTPKVVMERLGLEINRPYKDLYSFDSSRGKALATVCAETLGSMKLSVQTPRTVWVGPEVLYSEDLR